MVYNETHHRPIGKTSVDHSGRVIVTPFYMMHICHVKLVTRTFII